MFKSVSSKVSTIKSNLTTLGKNEPLSKFSLAIIIILDIFLLNIMFKGLDDHTRQLTSPYDYISNTCQEMLIDDSWQAESRLNKLQALMNSYELRSIYSEDTDENKIVQPKCAEFDKKLKQIRSDRALADEFRKRQLLKNKADTLNNKIASVKDSYFIGQTDKSLNTSGINNAAKGETEELNSAVLEMKGIDSRINNDQNVKALWSMLESKNEQLRETLKSELYYQNFWFPVKVVFWQLLFLAPLLIIGYFWNSISIRKERDVQTLVSSHLLLITSIPIVSRIVDILLEIIPHKLLKNLWDYMVAMHLTAVWDYGVIVLSIAGALLAIYFVQKKLFNKRSMFIKRLGKGICFSCGHKLPRGLNSPNYCPHCGVEYMTKCTKCGGLTYKSAIHCHLCGNEQNK